MYSYQCEIKRIIDGDTVVVDIDLGFSMWLRDISVRLLHINAPEVRTRDLVVKAAGLKSKARVEELLPIGSTQNINTVLDKEKFGRVLGDIILNNKESVSAIMVAEGLAEPFYV